MVLFAFLAAVAVILSGAGLYALMSSTVSQRTREIGIRTALGSRPGAVLLAIARRAFVQLLVGVAARRCGVVAAWTGRLRRRQRVTRSVGDALGERRVHARGGDARVHGTGSPRAAYRAGGGVAGGVGR